MRNIRQNLFLAFAYNAVKTPAAAGWATVAISLSSVSMSFNTLRLRDRNYGTRGQAFALLLCRTMPHRDFP